MTPQSPYIRAMCAPQCVRKSNMTAAGESHDLVISHVHRAVRQMQNHVRDIEVGVGNSVAKKEEASPFH